MYADREETVSQKSVKERLNGNSGAASSTRRSLISGKRRRDDDDKWEHDLFDSDEPQISNRSVGPRDLRLKLQKRSIDQATQIVRGSASGGVRDLREKLSGTMHSRPAESSLPPLRPKPVLEAASKPPRKSVISEAPVAETKKIASTITKKKSQQKVETVDSFLESLGLEKYSILFQAEEVDMAALVHMGDEDLKTMGMPMGPRKKILSALEAKV